VRDQIATRRLRIIKYRGSSHGSDEYPFLITSNGVSILPITSLSLNYLVSSQRISTGITRLDSMLDGQGYFRGSSILVSGPAGSGKSSLAASFINAACQRGESCFYLAFEESVGQILRNMRSIGIDLQPWVDQGLLHFYASRPSHYGLELHLLTIQDMVSKLNPAVIVIDPISNLQSTGTRDEAKSMLIRLIDYLKSKQITTMLTDLTHGGGSLERSNEDISSLIDTWLLLRDIEQNGERNRAIYILKSRGMAHSNQIREFLISSSGIDLVDVYLGSSGVLTGSARAAQENQERDNLLAQQEMTLRQQREKDRKRLVLQAQITALQAEMENLAQDAQTAFTEEEQKAQFLADNQARMARMRKADR
jgi:circadian clock protein KaiC